MAIALLTYGRGRGWASMRWLREERQQAGVTLDVGEELRGDLAPIAFVTFV